MTDRPWTEEYVSSKRKALTSIRSNKSGQENDSYDNEENTKEKRQRGTPNSIQKKTSTPDDDVKRRKRNYDQHSSSNEDGEESLSSSCSLLIKKQRRKQRYRSNSPSHKPTRRRRHNSLHNDTDSLQSSSSSSSSSTTSIEMRKRQKRKKKSKHKSDQKKKKKSKTKTSEPKKTRKKDKRSGSKRENQSEQDRHHSSIASDLEQGNEKLSRKLQQPTNSSSIQIQPEPYGPPPNSLVEQQQQQQQQQEQQPDCPRRNMAPMTREQYESLQSQLREVYDPETGRMRLVRGTGEIVERIVSRSHHQAINRQATYGDGAFFHRQALHQAASRSSRQTNKHKHN